MSKEALYLHYEVSHTSKVCSLATDVLKTDLMVTNMSVTDMISTDITSQTCVPHGHWKPL